MRKGLPGILASMKSVKSKLVEDTKDEVKEKINDQVDPSAQYQVDENLMRPLEEKMDPIVGELETQKRGERE